MLWKKNLVFLFLCGLLIACNRGADTGKEIVEFWQFWTDPEAKAVIVQAVAEFERDHPDTKVRITDLTWNDGHQKIVSAFATGRPPDLLELGSDWIAQFAAQGVLKDLTAEKLKAENTLVGWPPAFWDNKYYALPWYLGTRVLFINCELARMVGLDCHLPPITWDNLIKWSEAMRNLGPQSAGFGANAPEKHRLYKKFLPFLWSNGGQILSEDGNFSIIDSDVAVTALDYYVKLARNGFIEKQDVLDEMFATGRLGMVISGDWLLKRLRNAENPPEFSLAMMPYPAPGRGGRISFAGGEYLAIPAKAKNPVGALELARTLVNETNSINLCIATGGATPANVIAIRNPYFIENEDRRVFVDQLHSSQAAPSHPKWVYIEQIIEEAVEKAMYKRLTPEEALEEAAREITDLLREE